eukprot:3330354-Amphidinium_carterae.1
MEYYGPKVLETIDCGYPQTKPILPECDVVTLKPKTSKRGKKFDLGIKLCKDSVSEMYFVV